MILLFAMALQAAPAPTDDVVVTALKRLRVSTQVMRGKVRACSIAATSGDAGIDRVACEATRDCYNSGVTAPEPLADCVDARVGSFVQARSGR